MNKSCFTLTMITQPPRTPAAAMRVRQGNKIKEYRKLRKLSGLPSSQQWLAAQCGVTKAAVSEWERGVSSPRQHVQLEIAKALNAPWYVLFAPPEAA